MEVLVTELRPLAVRLGFELGRPDLVAFAVFAIAVVLALIVHRLLHTLITTSLNGGGDTVRLMRRLRGPTRIVFIAVAITIALPIANFEPNIVALMRRVLAVCMIVFAGWSIIIALNSWADSVERRFKIDQEDNLLARKHYTQVRVLRRLGVFLTLFLTIAGVLMTFPAVRTYGISLFASAGVAGLIAGFAARPVLSNLIAGIQIAFAQPIRIDDVVIIEGEWGWIEEINATYVVVRIWDWRRLIVPLSHFIEKPFENWTRESASIIGSVFWHVDYTMPIAKMREKLDEILKESKHWDGNIANLQVTGARQDSVEVRALMSARTSPRAWDLRCEVREKMLAWLQAEYAYALPRRRAELVSAPEGQPAARRPDGNGDGAGALHGAA